jgi:hypothetical protein
MKIWIYRDGKGMRGEMRMRRRRRSDGEWKKR